MSTPLQWQRFQQCAVLTGVGHSSPMLRTVLVFFPMTIVAVGCHPAETGSAGPQEPTVVVAQPVTRQIVEYASFTGQIQPVNDVELRARVTGYLEKVCYQPGSYVEQDEVLFEIDPLQYRAKFEQATAKLETSRAQVVEATAKVAQAEAQVELSSAKLAVDQAVAKTPGAISKLKLDEAEAAVKEAAAMLEAARATVGAQEAAVKAAEADLEYAQLNLNWTKVKSPISGRADRNLLTVGNLVSADVTVLTNIVTAEEVYGYFNVDELTFLDIRKRIRAGALDKRNEVPVGVGLQDEEGFPHEGTVDLVANALGTGSGTMQVRAILKNPDKLLTPGNFVRIRIPIAAAQDKLLVPERAMISEQGDKFVLVVNKEEKIDKRKVKAGALDPKDKSMRVVEDGVAVDDWVVIQGRQRVRPETHVKTERVALPQT
jgi:multidrug efflux system membrane fusion protein